jgi:hypothetical protein
VVQACLIQACIIQAADVRAAVVPARIVWACMTRSAIIRAAIIWTCAVRACAVRACAVRACVGGRDQRERAEQQADEDLGAQQVHPAARAGRLHGLAMAQIRAQAAAAWAAGRNRPDSEAVPS